MTPRLCISKFNEKNLANETRSYEKGFVNEYKSKKEIHGHIHDDLQLGDDMRDLNDGNYFQISFN